ncbi:MAG: hypothetical protein WC505_05300 [Patescibacteria group bacterium]
MATAWYTLVVGILITLDGIIFLIFNDIDGFAMPNWYLGLMLLVGVIGIILGLIKVLKEKNPQKDVEHSQREAEEDVME